MIPKVTPFEVYQKYLSLKQHFNKVDYDYFEFKGKVRANANSFENRKDKHHFVRLSKIYKEEDLTKFFVSNFVKSSDLWIGNLTSPEGRENYISWKSILRFSSIFNEKIEESVMWPNLYSMCIKYAPFLVVNKQKYVDILKKQVELHYE